MNNFDLLLLSVAVDFIVLLLAYKLFGKNGVHTFIVVSVITANIQVSKGVFYDIAGLHIAATLGNAVFAGVFMANDLLNEKYSRQEARKAILKSIFFGIAFVSLMFVATLFISLDGPFYNKIDKTLDLLFSVDGKVLKTIFVSNAVYLMSQLFDILIYSKIRNYSCKIRWLWLRNASSTLLSQILDTTLITYGFILTGIIPVEYTLEMIISTLLIKYIIVLISIPLFYILVFTKPRKS